MMKTMIFPGRYVQGYNALAVLKEEAQRLGAKAVVLCDPFVYKNYLEDIKINLGEDCEAQYIEFGGECSDEEINRIRSLVDNADVVIGVGGGKTLDAAKILAIDIKAKIITVPTLASTDAPCSAVSVVYTSEGLYKRIVFHPRNPDCVLVDTSIIVKAPVRLLVAGMGDAFATYLEAKDCKLTHTKNVIGRSVTLSSFSLARLCHETLIENGVSAKLAAEQQVATPAFEAVVEANTFLSGMGFENCGLAGAHGIEAALTALDATHDNWHGEKVALGILVMMFLTPKKPALIDTVYSFCESVGLPTTLADVGLIDVTDNELMQVATVACKKGDLIDKAYSSIMDITPDKIFGTIKLANAEGIRRKKLAK